MFFVKNKQNSIFQRDFEKNKVIHACFLLSYMDAKKKHFFMQRLMNVFYEKNEKNENFNETLKKTKRSVDVFTQVT